MEVNITARRLELNDKLRAYIKDKITRFERFNSNIIDARVMLESEKFRTTAEIIIYVKNVRLTAKEESTDVYAAVDNALQNMKTQLVRYRGRIKKRRRQVMLGKLSRPIMGLFAEKKPAREWSPRIVKGDDFASKPMTARDAALELKLLDKEFIVFKNAHTNQVNVLYKRKNGEYGLVEPEF